MFLSNAHFYIPDTRKSAVKSATGAVSGGFAKLFCGAWEKFDEIDHLKNGAGSAKIGASQEKGSANDGPDNDAAPYRPFCTDLLCRFRLL